MEEQNELKTEIQNNFSNFSQCGSDGIDAVTEHLNQVWRCLNSPEQKELDVPSVPWLSWWSMEYIGIFGSRSDILWLQTLDGSVGQGFGRHEGILRNCQEVLAGGWVNLGAMDLDEFDKLCRGISSPVGIAVL